ncbi:hypothetical protein [Sorangium sp. So ce426]|uniref:hypothetical protein n=1 Tax=Sorangium sp. So ce426 TaxID=3133312 RepID=UPI003F5BB85F
MRRARARLLSARRGASVRRPPGRRKQRAIDVDGGGFTLGEESGSTESALLELTAE